MSNVHTLPVNQEIIFPALQERRIRLFVKRLDLVHPLISGNKFYKLKYNILEAQAAGHTRLLTFGGAFSNHIFAAAASAKASGMNIVGCIRGELVFPLNPTLEAAKKMGMILHPMPRRQYRNKTNPEVLDSLIEQYGPAFIVPEGGTNSEAIRGCREILQPDDAEFDFICASYGTGGTLAGLVSTAGSAQTVIGFSALKGEFAITAFQELLKDHQITPACHWQMRTDYHFGGYAKFNPNLIEGMREFYKLSKIPLDPVYTGKMAVGLMDLILQNYFPPDSSILMIHSGGLQGIKGFEMQSGCTLYPSQN